MGSAFDHVVVTLPYTALRRVDFADAALDHRKAAAIRELGYGTETRTFSEPIPERSLESACWSPRQRGSVFMPRSYPPEVRRQVIELARPTGRGMARRPAGTNGNLICTGTLTRRPQRVPA